MRTKECIRQNGEDKSGEIKKKKKEHHWELQGQGRYFLDEGRQGLQEVIFTTKQQRG